MQDASVQKTENQFFDNPEKADSTGLKNVHVSKDALQKKRKLIQKELRQLMSKVDQYELEKSIATKKVLKQDKKIKKVISQDNQLVQKFNFVQLSKKPHSVKQSPKENRYQNKNSKQRQTSSRLQYRTNSEKSKEFLPPIEKSRLRISQDRQKYINYLPEIDFRTPLPNKTPKQEIKKRKLINYLQKAQQFEKQAIKKIGQIKKGKDNLNYIQYINVQKQVDSVFVNSLKARVQCALKM